MKITEKHRAIVLQGLRKKKQSRTWLAKKMQLNKSWATRFFGGGIKNLSDEQVEQLQELLEFEFFALNDTNKGTLPANPIARELETNEAFAEVAGCLYEAMKDKIYTPRYIPTKQMSSMGKEIEKIVLENKGKNGKMTRLVLELLA